VNGESERLERQLERLQADTSDEAIWRSVELARHVDRPYTIGLRRALHRTTGSSCTATAAARTTARSSPGSAKLDGRTVVLIGHQKGRDVKERLDRQFGMAYPEGYHKAMRVMEIAERFRVPRHLARRHAGRLSGRRRPSSTARAARSPAPRPRWRA